VIFEQIRFGLRLSQSSESTLWRLSLPQIGFQGIKIWVLVFQYKIVKKEEIQELAPPEPDNPLMRKKKTPEELAREAEAEDEDELTSQSQPLSSFFSTHFTFPLLHSKDLFSLRMYIHRVCII